MNIPRPFWQSFVFFGFCFILCGGVFVNFSHQFLRAHLVEATQKNTTESVSIFANRIKKTIEFQADEATTLIDLIFKNALVNKGSKVKKALIKNMEEKIAREKKILAITLLRKDPSAIRGWRSVFRLRYPKGNRDWIPLSQFEKLGQKYPIYYERPEHGKIDLVSAKLSKGTRILRLSVPYGKRSKGRYKQILEIEIKKDWFDRILEGSKNYQHLVLDRKHRLISQSSQSKDAENKSSAFSYQEDLRHLPLLQLANATQSETGSLSYRLLPGNPLQFGSYHYVGYAGITVITQVSETFLNTTLNSFKTKSIQLGIACLLISLFLGFMGLSEPIGKQEQQKNQNENDEKEDGLEISERSPPQQEPVEKRAA